MNVVRLLFSRQVSLSALAAAEGERSSVLSEPCLSFSVVESVSVFEDNIRSCFFSSPVAEPKGLDGRERKSAENEAEDQNVKHFPFHYSM